MLAKRLANATTPEEVQAVLALWARNQNEEARLAEEKVLREIKREEIKAARSAATPFEKRVRNQRPRQTAQDQPTDVDTKELKNEIKVRRDNRGVS